MKKYILLILILLTSNIFADDTFKIIAKLEKKFENIYTINVFIDVPNEHYIYADKFNIKTEDINIKLTPKNITHPIEIEDSFFEKKVLAYTKPFSFQYEIEELNIKEPLKLIIELQGCNKETCFLPEKKIITLYIDKDQSITDTSLDLINGDTNEDNDIFEILNNFSIRGQIAGYLSPKKFLKKIQEIENKDYNSNTFFQSDNYILIFFIILIGGLALNLTPCVLPIIPINLAIIGAGAKASSKTKGFILGLTYSSGMAISYGVLGVIVILTGSTFGTLNSSPFFNFAIAVLFFILSVGMLGIVNIDLSKFRPNSKNTSKATYGLIFFMGAISSLLAGACVAPVVISVLLLSGNLYAEGKSISIFLPFILGIGMGLPWPFLGAGLSLLPKPGKWMENIKKIFAILIFFMSIYYFKLGIDLFNTSSLSYNNTTKSYNITYNALNDWNIDLLKGLKYALASDKPVIIDFWATWCKNCIAMDKVTFKNNDVVKKLNSDYIKIKFQAENPTDSTTKKILDYFKVKGLPTVIIMNIKKE